MRSLFVEQALANRYINRTWLDIMATLPLAELDRPQGAFFTSIFGTWNHILLGDRIWMARFAGQPNPYTNLRERIAHTFEDFRKERSATDDLLVRMMETEQDFSRMLVYRNTQGAEFRNPLYQMLSHFFAHQAHHRGQISQMCHERKIAIPDGGLIEYYRTAYA